MQTQKTTIRVLNVDKTFKLYERPFQRVKEAFHPFRKKYFCPFKALQDISLDIFQGETVGIVGRNGSGKSTLLQVICGILQATRGKVEVKGRISALLELGAGFNPEFTGRENIYINAAILGLNPGEIESCIPDIIKFAEIGDFLDQPVKSYSSGMYVRLAFAIAINVHPDILVVDEALSVGDTLFQAKCFKKFRDFQEQGVTILFVTHSLDLITTYCSKAYLLEKGHIISQGKPKSVVDDYNRMIVNCAPQNTNDVTHGENCLPQKEKVVEAKTQENRYGNGKATIIDAGIFSMKNIPVRALVREKEYQFKMTVRFNQKVENPIFAFTIKDVKGFDISGTNTLFKKIKIENAQVGDKMETIFKHKIPLNTGKYLLSFGCAGFEKGQYVVFDRRYDHIVFEVVGENSSVGFFDMNSAIEVCRQ